MSNPVIIAKCQGGHTQRLVMRGFSLEQVERIASIMDGSIAPDLNQRMRKQDMPVFVIGRCCLCGKFFDCNVVESEYSPDAEVTRGEEQGRHVGEADGELTPKPGGSDH